MFKYYLDEFRISKGFITYELLSERVNSELLSLLPSYTRNVNCISALRTVLTESP
jgi:hypothetical protein